MPIEPAQKDVETPGVSSMSETLPPPTLAPDTPISVPPAPVNSASPANPADSLVGQQIGPYILRRKLGQGGMGAVFEGVHESIGQRTAIKVLHSRFSEDDKVAERFLNEARATSIVRHPGLMKVYDQQKLPNGALCLIMEFLDGESLESRLQSCRRSGKRLPTAQAVEIICQAASALKAAHEAGIVHCDLKPDNVFLVPDAAIPGGERIKLLDFGIAKFLTHSLSQTTAMDVVMGTPRYMAPEQCEGRDRVDSKVDVYALGVIFYELLAGERPFEAQTPQALMRQHLNLKAPPLRERAPWVSESLSRLVHDMLAKEGLKRPSMDQVQERLAQNSSATASQSMARYALLAAALLVLGFGSWFGWHHGKRAVSSGAADQQAIGSRKLPNDACIKDAGCKEHHDKAVNYYNQQYFEEALSEFQAAYAVRQMPLLLINIGRTLQKLGRAKEAIIYYERFQQAESRPDPAVKAKVAEYLNQARALVGTEMPPPPAPPGAANKLISEPERAESAVAARQPARPGAAPIPAPAEPGPQTTDSREIPIDDCLRDAPCKEHFDKAIKYYDQKHFEEALSEFKAAYAVRQMPYLLINIGRILQKLGRPQEAISYYERFQQTETYPDPTVKAKVTGYLKQARALVGSEMLRPPVPPGAANKPIRDQERIEPAVAVGRPESPGAVAVPAVAVPAAAVPSPTAASAPPEPAAEGSRTDTSRSSRRRGTREAARRE